MGRRPEPKSDKIARGTYRADRDKSMTVAIADEVPDPPAGLGEAGRQFWADAYGQPWVGVSDRTMVQLVARKLDEREQLGAESFPTPADEWRKHRTLKEIDRDVASGLDQLLLTPNSRQRAGIATLNPAQKVPTALELMQARRRGEISREEYDLLMEPERARQAAELKEQVQREQLERISDASLNRIEALTNPDGMKPKLDDQD
jgi:hypothetical protein